MFIHYGIAFAFQRCQFIILNLGFTSEDLGIKIKILKLIAKIPVVSRSKRVNFPKELGYIPIFETFCSFSRITTYYNMKM